MTPALPAPPVTGAPKPLALNALPTASWMTGSHYVLPAGKQVFKSNGLPQMPSNVILEGVAGATDKPPLTAIDFTANAPYQHLLSLPRASKQITLRNLNLTVNGIESILCEASDVEIDNVWVNGGLLAKVRNSQRLHVTRCQSPVLPAYWIFIDWAGAGVRDVTIDNCSVGGSIREHCMRIYGAHRLLVQDCKLHNPNDAPWAVKKGECAKVCAGSDIVFQRVDFLGNLQPGPNYQRHWNDSAKPGIFDGKTYAPQADITPLINGLTFDNCTQNVGNIRLMPGVTRLNFNGGSLNVNTSYVFAVQGNSKPSKETIPRIYSDRPVVSGEIANLKCTTHGSGAPQMFIANWPGGMKTRAGCTLNNKAVPVSG